MPSIRGVTLAVRFVCELAMLAAFVVWGFETGNGAAGWVLGIGAPFLAIMVWGTFVAPKARRPVPPPTRLVIELVLFDLAALALAASGRWQLAVVLLVVAVGTSILNFVQGRQGRATG